MWFLTARRMCFFDFPLCLSLTLFPENLSRACSPRVKWTSMENLLPELLKKPGRSFPASPNRKRNVCGERPVFSCSSQDDGEQFQKFFCLFYRKRKNPPGIPPAPLKKAACGIFFRGGAIAVKNGKCSAAMAGEYRNSRDTTGVRGGAWCGPIHLDGVPGAYRRTASTPG